MDINQLLNQLKNTYSFEQAECREISEAPGLEFTFSLSEDQITTLIAKAGRLSSIVESCANMISICDPGSRETLMKTSLQCIGANQLRIRTTSSMVKMLVETLFD